MIEGTNTIASVNVLGYYFVLGHYLFLKVHSFLERKLFAFHSLRCRCNDARDKYPSIFSHQMKVSFYILSQVLLSLFLFPLRPVNMMFCCRLSDGERHRLFAG